MPNDLFYIRNHWTDCPEIDINTYRLVVDGEVENPLSLSFDEVLGMAQQRFQVTFECCGNSPVPDYWAKATRTGSVMEMIKGHGIMGNAEWAGVSLKDLLARAGVKDSAVEVMFEGRGPRARRNGGRSAGRYLRAQPAYRKGPASRHDAGLRNERGSRFP